LYKEDKPLSPVSECEMVSEKLDNSIKENKKKEEKPNNLEKQNPAIKVQENIDSSKITGSKIKPIIIHLHIFKNAGMTIEWALEKNFKENYSMESYGTHSGGIIPLKSVIEYKKKNPNLVVFSSHNFRFPIPLAPFFHIIPIVFIRHPIDRIFSEYRFMRRNEGTTKGIYDEKAKSLSVKDYIRWGLEKNKIMLVNPQLEFLSKKSFGSPIVRLTSAIHYIKTCPIVGVVDRFDESMVMEEEYLKNFFQEIDLSYVKQNVSKDRKKNLKERIESNRADIGDKLMDFLIEKNKIDFKIYSTANEELDIRKEHIENFEKKLSDYKERCKNLIKQKEINFTEGNRWVFLSEKNVLMERK